MKRSNEMVRALSIGSLEVIISELESALTDARLLQQVQTEAVQTMLHNSIKRALLFASKQLEREKEIL